ncbi:MAG: aspartate kinase [Verrucomicrobia bacterium CG_4_10_14_3_um_filter_43_23]|nr:MAG: aspartate kinase [Verrucomicrobia bacterium CG1_02_43_26]PIP58728.1 MAG: aspartate kinase [Verrucomicrobia bacterium CG22_combo_CG10-13_8_21_14_all_43_17]PIX58742.1 MAG: aspartate kinase [Verrucomicrobia bacterium CG_4_10_14_3_um_filter_43_23]PIY62952.1 MAG: aspartate kinase [Verrucomicrobia bacterium CG_4_10_14_0_8_um_filter_43_34]PJA43921.1 MAG: aspartate kinase [Verrucomicrobia bacterium CG_4_9_14_3_um_filter_43_20]
MALIIQKYGGTSVKDIDRIKAVAERIKATYDAGNQVVVVVSARAGVTNELIQRARQINPQANKREMDMLLAVGEQETIALMAIALHTIDVPAVSRTGAQAGIITDHDHTCARIVNIDGGDLLEQLSQNKVVIVAGFQGMSREGNITTLGRGGSDLTAIAIGAVVKADIVQIFTDVDGVYTADPRIVPEATKIECISYEEMLELASQGAKVMQARSVEFAQKYDVPFEVRSSYNNEPGTIVKKEAPVMEEVLVRGTVLDVNQAKITVDKLPDKPGTASMIFVALGKAKIMVDMIIQNVGEAGEASLTFTVNRDEAHTAKKVVAEALSTLGWEGTARDGEIAIISVIGIGMRSHAGVAATMFEALAKGGVNIKTITTSEIKISCAIDPIDAQKALKVVHKAFRLDEPESIRMQKICEK